MGDLIMRFLKNDSGVTAIEYALIAALIAVVIITSLTNVGTALFQLPLKTISIALAGGG